MRKLFLLLPLFWVGQTSLAGSTYNCEMAEGLWDNQCHPVPDDSFRIEMRADGTPVNPIFGSSYAGSYIFKSDPRSLEMSDKLKELYQFFFPSFSSTKYKESNTKEGEYYDATLVISHDLFEYPDHPLQELASRAKDCLGYPIERIALITVYVPTKKQNWYYCSIH